MGPNSQFREREATGSTNTIKSLTSLSLFLANVLKHVETRSCSWRRQVARIVLLGFQQIVFIPAQNKWFKKEKQLVACDEAREGRLTLWGDGDEIKCPFSAQNKPEREDKLCEEMAMKLSVLSLHKTTYNVIFIPLPRPAGPTSPLQPPFSIPYF